MDFSKTGLIRIRWDGTVLPILRLTGYHLFGGARVADDTVIFHTIDYGPQGGARTNPVSHLDRYVDARQHDEGATRPAPVLPGRDGRLDPDAGP